MDVMSLLAEAGRWALIGAGLAAALIGFQYITRGTAVRHVRGVGGDGRPVAADEPAFPLSVAMLTGATLLPGNRVEIALNGDGTYERLWADLRSARESITLQVPLNKYVGSWKLEVDMYMSSLGRDVPRPLPWTELTLTREKWKFLPLAVPLQFSREQWSNTVWDLVRHHQE